MFGDTKAPDVQKEIQAASPRDRVKQRVIDVMKAAEALRGSASATPANSLSASEEQAIKHKASRMHQEAKDIDQMLQEGDKARPREH